MCGLVMWPTSRGRSIDNSVNLCSTCASHTSPNVHMWRHQETKNSKIHTAYVATLTTLSNGRELWLSDHTVHNMPAGGGVWVAPCSLRGILNCRHGALCWRGIYAAIHVPSSSKYCQGYGNVHEWVTVHWLTRMCTPGKGGLQEGLSYCTHRHTHTIPHIA